MILFVGRVQQASFMYHLHTSSVCFKLGCSAVSCDCLTPKWGKLSRFGVGSPQKDCRRQPFPESMIGRWKPLKFLSHIWVGWLGRAHMWYEKVFLCFDQVCHWWLGQNAISSFSTPKSQSLEQFLLINFEVVSYPRPCFPNTSNYPEQDGPLTSSKWIHNPFNIPL